MLKYGLLIGAVLILSFVGGLEASHAPKTTYVTVAAGSMDRQDVVVSFELDSELKAAAYELRDEAGQNTPLQYSGRNASFILRELNAGQKKTFRLVEKRKANQNKVDFPELAKVANRLEIKIRGRKVFSFIAQPSTLPTADIKPIFLRGGYIHPVLTPGGHVVTDDYPPDHYHHHGIWFAWTKTEFEGGHPDFWNVGDSTGRVDFESVDQTWAGPVNAGFVSHQKYVALTGKAPKTALNEQWEVRVYNLGGGPQPYFLFDIVATQECATNSPLILEEYRYGGMGIRGHRDWKDKTKVAFLTSEGKTRLDGNATRARWCHIGGTVDGQVVGIAVLDHPGNFRAPQPLRIHPDDPYFNYAPSQAGRFEIEPGKKFVQRYRYVVADGRPDPKLLERLWNDYANPPEVTVTRR
jgi:Methane oxygenase PmoA